MADFKKVKVTNIEGVVEDIDTSKIIGNLMYTQGQDVDVCECGKKIYYGEVVELTEPQKAFIREKILPQLTYIFRVGVEQQLM